MSLKPFPRIILHGIDDNSAQQIPLEPERLPQHLPACFLLSEKSEDVAIASGSSLVAQYGDLMFNQMSPFYNHQSVLAREILRQGNQIMVVPIKLPNSKKATLRLSLEIVPFTIVKDGQPNRNAVRLIWRADEIEQGNYGKGEIQNDYREGTTTSAVGNKRLGIIIDDNGDEYSVPSTLLPIMDFQADSRGSYGNRLGLMIDAPDENSNQPTDTSLAARLNSFIYRLTLVTKARQGLSYDVTESVLGDVSVDFVLKPNAVDTRTGLNVSLGSVITDSYTLNTDNGMPVIQPPFKDPMIYMSNIETALSVVAQQQEIIGTAVGGTETKSFEIPGIFDDPDEAIEKMYAINIFTGRDYQGKQYPNIDMTESYMFDGISFGRESVVYARGGSDGFTYTSSFVVDEMETLKEFDEAVRLWCESFNEYTPLFDSAKYPFSTLWDSGFSIDTKKALLQPMGQHKRIWVALATQSVADYTDEQKTKFSPVLPNTPAQEIAIATMLNAAAHLYPESELYGTSTCRAIIVGRCGELRDGTYRGHLPLSISVASKIAAYCGAGDGYWKNENAIDSEKGRIDELFKNVNITYQPTTAYDKSWSAGMIWVQNFDRSSVFFPAYQTVYNDSTSVLDSVLVIIAATYIQRCGEQTWRELVGNGLLGTNKFLEESNRKINDKTANRFDGRFTIVPDTFYTQNDERRGFSWSTIVRLYADPTTLVNSFTIKAYRRADLNTGTGG